MVDLVKRHICGCAMDLDREYQCPDCGEICGGYELIHPTDHGTLYVCPNCGVVQEEVNIIAQLGDME